MVINDIKTAAKVALDIQNASNMAAVLNAWKEVQPYCYTPGTGGLDRRHPIQILFLSKISSLMAVATDCIGGVYKGGGVENYEQDLFVAAYDKCQALVQEVQE